MAHELGKAVQGFPAIAQHAPEAKSVIEFGAGWGNTAIPLARAGLDICAVDIDEAFLKRIANESKALSTQLRTHHTDFLEAAKIACNAMMLRFSPQASTTVWSFRSF